MLPPPSARGRGDPAGQYRRMLEEDPALATSERRALSSHSPDCDELSSPRSSSCRGHGRGWPYLINLRNLPKNLQVIAGSP